jgi:hypothetical protein
MTDLKRRTRGIIAALATVLVSVAVAGAAPSPAYATPSDTLCTGTWNGTTATVIYRRSPDGRLDWSFFISNQTRLFLGPTVAVSMPFAYVNGLAINPPYQEHDEVNTYDFHSSIRNVQFIGGTTRLLATGDILTLYWLMYGFVTDNAADAYVVCKVPAPGSG